MVHGQYVRRFADASHVLFSGNLNCPAFRAIAIQPILDVKKTVVIVRSGSLKIRRKPETEVVSVTYVDPVFGKKTAKGFPFKDKDTPAAKAAEEQSP